MAVTQDGANMRRGAVGTAAARRVAVRALTVGGNGLAGGEGAPVSVTRRADLQCRCSGGIRAFGGRRRLMITCPLPSPLDLGRTSKFAILSSVSSSTRQMTSSTAPSQSGNVRKLSPDPHPRCPATTPRSLSTRAPAVRSLTALHPPPPPRPAASTLTRLPARPPPTHLPRRCPPNEPLLDARSPVARDSFEGSPQAPGRAAPTPSTPSA